VFTALTRTSTTRGVLRRALALAILLVTAAAPGAEASAQVLSEYEVKAAFLVNFFKFVEWPPEAFATDTAPLVLVVVGEDPFGESLDEAIRGKKVGGHPLAVRRVGAGDDPGPAHMVFVSRSVRSQLAEILRRPHQPGALFVSDIEGFCVNGGAITFVIVQDRVRFEINIASASKQRLRIDSKLLTLATVVHRNGA
jgi:hypothetical protein